MVEWSGLSMEQPGGRNRINKVMEVRNISGFNENTIT